MIRRSKIKVRPAIKKPSTQGSAPTTPKHVNGPSLTPENGNTTTTNAKISKPASTQVKSVTVDIAPEKPLQLAQNETTAESDIKSANVNAPTSTSETPTKPQISRRRKLVACPTTAKKRVKTSNADAPIKFDTPTLIGTAPKKTFSELQEQTNQLISTDLGMQSFTLPPPLQPSSSHVEHDVLAGNASADFATLSTVTTGSLVDKEEEVNEDQAHANHSPTNALSDVNVNVSAEVNVKEHRCEIVPTPGAETTSGTSILCSSEQNKIREISPETKTLDENKKSVVGLGSEVKKLPTTKSKMVSVTVKHRNSAMAKLRKLKEGQEDSEKWPELDQNLVSMSDLIFLNPPNKTGLKLGMNVRREDAEKTIAQREKTPEPEPSSSAQEEKEDSALPVPQIRIAEDGSVVIDEESLVVDTRKPPERTAHTVYEVGRDTMVNQCSFLRRPYPRPARWSQQETDKFYKCLCIVGAEFSLMGAMFRARSSDDLRRKFKRERKLNPARVDKALMQQHLSKWTDDMFEPDEIHDKSLSVNSRPHEETVK